jgi:hypothetical protein
MNEPRAKTLRQLLLLIIASAVLLWPVGHPLRAQSRPLPTQISQLGRVRDLTTSEADVRARESEAERSKQRDPQAIMAEVNEDFARLRELQELMSKATVADAALNYKDISETTGEIKKRSTRLKANLALPESKQEEKNRALREPADGELKPSLTSLDELIQSFIQNPIFSDSGAIDKQLAARARRDLEDIISLSEKIRKSAEKLDKKAARTQ